MSSKKGFSAYINFTNNIHESTYQFSGNPISLFRVDYNLILTYLVSYHTRGGAVI